MAATATAERNWVRHHPELPAYFHDRFAEAMRMPQSSGRAARLVRWVPARAPIVGRAIWMRADAYFRQQLAPAFLEQWDRDEAPASV
jgi:hypothetical protein